MNFPIPTLSPGQLTDAGEAARLSNEAANSAARISMVTRAGMNARRRTERERTLSALTAERAQNDALSAELKSLQAIQKAKEKELDAIASTASVRPEEPGITGKDVATLALLSSPIWLALIFAGK